MAYVSGGGGGAGANVTFTNQSTGETFTLPARVLRGAFGGTNFYGSEQSKELTGGKEPVTQRIQTVVVETVKDTFSFGEWIAENWKAAIIAIVCLIILIK